MTVTEALAGSAPPERDRRHLFHPLVDFLCLGGLSLLILPWLWFQTEASLPALAVVSLALSDVVNHPHFAHSYQIFYRGFRARLRGDGISRELRVRYLLAGLIVPLALAAFLLATWWQQNATWMAYAANAMLFLVGWHYTKQGYGMLMVDAALKKRFFGGREKQVLVANAYTTWLFYWVVANWSVREYELWGLAYYALAIPRWVVWTMAVAMAVTTLLVLGVFVRALGAGRSLPWTGVTVYLITLYVWTIGRLEPAFLLFVPAFHSLQYLIVVWRFELNRLQAHEARAQVGPVPRMLLFVALGVVFGLAGFWWLPRVLESGLGDVWQLPGAAVFFFMCWVFINVHHYFIDNVIWRRDNPETKAYLFA